jgi:hypothetical protein
VFVEPDIYIPILRWALRHFIFARESRLNLIVPEYANAIGKLVIVAARGDMGMLLCARASSQLEYAFLA